MKQEGEKRIKAKVWVSLFFVAINLLSFFFKVTSDTSKLGKDKIEIKGLGGFLSSFFRSNLVSLNQNILVK